MGLMLSYHIEDENLILSGTVGSRRITYELKNVPLKRVAK